MAAKGTLSVIKYYLDGSTINMKPVRIGVDDDLKKIHMRKEEKITREVPINLKIQVQKLIRGMVKDKVLEEVQMLFFLPNADGTLMQMYFYKNNLI